MPCGRRVEALRARLLAAHLDALLVTSLANVRYLTGFSGSSGIALIGAGDPVLLTDFRYREQALAEAGHAARVRIEPTSLWDGVWAALADTPGLSVVGFESAQLTHRDFQRLLEQGTRWHWRPSTDLVEGLRAVKDEGEVDCIARAGQLATEALRRTLDAVRPGLAELEVCGILERHLRELGSTEHPFPPIIASGARTALPHARPSGRAIASGDFLLLDFGATVDGYCSDLTRTVVLGRAGPRQREVHEVVHQAHAAALSGMRSGMRGREADALARDVIAAAGYADQFGHGLGHGLGLEVHEAPRVSRLAEDPLPAGAVVTVEPGVYVPDWGGVRIEDDVWLAEGRGAVLLTEFPRDLLEIGS